MDLTKHREFFNPDDIKSEIHIIGCGAVGSTIAEQLARLGIQTLHLYDFDIVNAHNTTNQTFFHQQINEKKTKALTAILKLINPDIEVIQHEAWTQGTPLSGIVIIAVDSIETRKQIIEDNKYNNTITAMFDTRMRLTDAQHFAALWDEKGINFLLSTMNFTSEEAKESTPTSACGTALNVTPTVRLICTLAVANIINVLMNKPITKTILTDTFNMTLDAFDEQGLKE